MLAVASRHQHVKKCGTEQHATAPRVAQKPSTPCTSPRTATASSFLPTCTLSVLLIPIYTITPTCENAGFRGERILVKVLFSLVHQCPEVTGVFLPASEPHCKHLHFLRSLVPVTHNSQIFFKYPS